jgi:primosomal protein N' (replication factor Y)
MVEHRFTRRLACHHCGHVMPTPKACPECKEEDSLVACGPGVERIADEVASLFPEARNVIVTSDTIWSPAKAAEFVARMEAGEIDIVIGTQLVTKGYHFPNLTLVGVVDADLGLDGGDLRASERSQQIRRSGAPGAGRKPGGSSRPDPRGAGDPRAGERRRQKASPPRPMAGAQPPCRPSAASPRSSSLRGPGRGDRAPA